MIFATNLSRTTKEKDPIQTSLFPCFVVMLSLELKNRKLILLFSYCQFFSLNTNRKYLRVIWD